jgi:signal transduction histidine kinase
MNQLITDLLQLSRAGRMRAEIESVDVANVVKLICENLAEQIKEKSVQVVMHEPIPMISADKKKIYQVFENLLVNALKYGCVGPNPKIEVGGFEHEQEIHIYVKDNGPGIAKQYHKKIFKLFERLENDNRGTGVGLAIVSRIMQIHNGRIWLESDPESKTNPGSCFWLSFPRIYQKPTEGEDSDTGV